MSSIWATNNRDLGQSRWLAYLLNSLILCLTATGCGPQVLPPSDPSQARQHLERFLQKWKTGAAQSTLQELTPPIISGDESWANGEQLIAYKIISPPKSDGRNVDIKVQLTTKRPRGKKQRHEIAYIVTTTPRITVFRRE